MRTRLLRASALNKLLFISQWLPIIKNNIRLGFLISKINKERFLLSQFSSPQEHLPWVFISHFIPYRIFHNVLSLCTRCRYPYPYLFFFLLVFYICFFISFQLYFFFVDIWFHKHRGTTILVSLRFSQFWVFLFEFIPFLICYFRWVYYVLVSFIHSAEPDIFEAIVDCFSFGFFLQ